MITKLNVNMTFMQINVSHFYNVFFTNNNKYIGHLIVAENLQFIFKS